MRLYDSYVALATVSKEAIVCAIPSSTQMKWIVSMPFHLYYLVGGASCLCIHFELKLEGAMVSKITNVQNVPQSRLLFVLLHVAQHGALV